MSSLAVSNESVEHLGGKLQNTGNLLGIKRKIAYFGLYKETNILVRATNDAEVNAIIGDHGTTVRRKRITKLAEQIPSTSSGMQVPTSSKRKTSLVLRETDDMDMQAVDASTQL